MFTKGAAQRICNNNSTDAIELDVNTPVTAKKKRKKTSGGSADFSVLADVVDGPLTVECMKS